MSDIYRQATQVYAWLGPADHDSDQVMDFLIIFGEEAEACGIHHAEGPHLEIWGMLASQDFAVHDLKSSSSMIRMENGDFRVIRRQKLANLFDSISGWHQQDNLLPVRGIPRLFTRPWWGRIWLLQEVSLTENAELVCGNRRISRSRCCAAINAYAALWEVLSHNANNISQPTTQYHRLITGEYHRSITDNLFHHRTIVMLSTWRIYRPRSFALAALLRATCVGSIDLSRHGPHHFE